MANYQLAISNIAWLKDDDEAVYTAMQQAGFTGLELARHPHFFRSTV